MIGVGYEFTTIVSRLPPCRCVDAVLFLNLCLLPCS
jgi:hypothetical protein